MGLDYAGTRIGQTNAARNEEFLATKGTCYGGSQRRTVFEVGSWCPSATKAVASTAMDLPRL